MPEVKLLGPTACALSALALPFFTGCASHSTVAERDQSLDLYAGVVSARDYGYVRPARDVKVTARSQTVERDRIGHGQDLWQRVRSGMQLNLQAHAHIDSALERFRRDPRYLERLSQRGAPYLPVIVAEIERRGLPMELALLPHIESRYNPAATSPKSAAGIWQFMPSTARDMGLHLDEATDERRDVIASTRAALDYLERLNKRFEGDWELTMAAYNCGPGCVSAAIDTNRRQGLPTDFWSLNLPNETRQYVPQILAASRLVADARRYGQHLPAIADRIGVDVIRSNQPMDLAKLALDTGINLDELKKLNPDLKLGRWSRPDITALNVPQGQGARIRAKAPAIQLDALPVIGRRAAPARLAARQPPATPATSATRTHLVKTGETLAAVAQRHGLDRQTLAEANGLTEHDPLLPGQTLELPMRHALPAVITHRVQPGESLTGLARRYNVSTEEIRRWNQLADNVLKSGAMVRIYLRDRS
ncbi:membrane-bound lytic murein transglycosylase D [Allochromatium warmingii]|uniref:Membrane-bound lytic murein transglycosylase D n=1 Tax=Allochromatium warmingii TaxID=61595 RepID=A0A1H3FJS7_ALLWA|nr:transglycosylase SLT domain-containing protein [Allochromatium warmingii]SDX91047.1 membrane-bound lytic murein transglycosylase D [Allochromatium warmingii]